MLPWGLFLHADPGFLFARRLTVKLRIVSNCDDTFTAHGLPVLHRPPEPLDEHVVPPRALAVHAEGGLILDEHAGEGHVN